MTHYKTAIAVTAAVVLSAAFSFAVTNRQSRIVTAATLTPSSVYALTEDALDLPADISVGEYIALSQVPLVFASGAPTRTLVVSSVFIEGVVPPLSGPIGSPGGNDNYYALLHILESAHILAALLTTSETLAEEMDFSGKPIPFDPAGGSMPVHSEVDDGTVALTLLQFTASGGWAERAVIGATGEEIMLEGEDWKGGAVPLSEMPEALFNPILDELNELLQSGEGDLLPVGISGCVGLPTSYRRSGTTYELDKHFALAIHFDPAPSWWTPRRAGNMTGEEVTPWHRNTPGSSRWKRCGCVSSGAYG